MKKAFPEGLSEEGRRHLEKSKKSNWYRQIKRIKSEGVDAWKPRSTAPHTPKTTKPALRDAAIRAWEDNPGLSYDAVWKVLNEAKLKIGRSTVRNILRRRFKDEIHDPSTAKGSHAIFESRLRKGEVKPPADLRGVLPYNPRLRWLGEAKRSLPGKFLTALVQSQTLDLPKGPPKHYNVTLIFDDVSGFAIGGIALGYANFKFLSSHFDLCSLAGMGPCFQFYPDTTITRSPQPLSDPIGGALLNRVVEIASGFKMDPDRGFPEAGVKAVQDCIDIYNNAPIESFPNHGKSPLEYLLEYGPAPKDEGYFSNVTNASLPLALGNFRSLNRGESVVLGVDVSNYLGRIKTGEDLLG